MPNATARAWVSVTSAVAGSCEPQQRDVDVPPVAPTERLAHRGASTYTRGWLASGNATLSGDDGDADDAQRAAAADDDPVAGPQVPLARQPALDHHLARRRARRARRRCA